MSFLKSLTLAVTLSSATLVAPAQADSFPGNVTEVTEGLIAVGMAIELADKCNTVSERRLRGVNFLFSLKRILEDRGFSNAEINAYIDNRTEKARLETLARQRLNALGVRADTPATYCTVAQAQIAQGTQVGQLLR